MIRYDFASYVMMAEGTNIYTGRCGIAYALLQIDPETSISIMNTEADEALRNLKRRKYKDYDHSFLYGNMGILVLSLCYTNPADDRALELSSAIIEIADRALKRDDIPDECLFGRSGLLYGLIYAINHLSMNPRRVCETEILPTFRTLASETVAAILRSGRSHRSDEELEIDTLRKNDNNNNPMKKKSRSDTGEDRKSDEWPLYWEWHGKAYLGAVHGFSGILMVLAQAVRILEDNCFSKRDHLDILATFKAVTGQVI